VEAEKEIEQLDEKEKIRKEEKLAHEKEN